jgi:hypothetical protein
MDLKATQVKLIFGVLSTAKERPLTWMLTLPARPGFLEVIGREDDPSEFCGSHYFDLDNTVHVKHLIAYSCVCCAYETFEDSWLSSLVDRNDDIWNKTLHPIVVGLVEACEYRSIDSDATVEVFLRLLDELGDSKVSCREEFEEKLPSYFQNQLLEEEVPRTNNVNEQAERIIKLLESGTYTRYLEGATSIIEEIGEIKDEVQECLNTVDASISESISECGAMRIVEMISKVVVTNTKFFFMKKLIDLAEREFKSYGFKDVDLTSATRLGVLAIANKYYIDKAAEFRQVSSTVIIAELFTGLSCSGNPTHENLESEQRKAFGELQRLSQRTYQECVAYRERNKKWWRFRE